MHLYQNNEDQKYLELEQNCSQTSASQTRTVVTTTTNQKQGLIG